MKSMRLKGVAFGAVAFFLAVMPVSAFKLKTVPTPTEAKVSDLASIWTVRGFLDHSTRMAVDRFLKETIHEAITHRIWGCEDVADGDLCFNANHAPLDFLVGVRWNDNPPFQVNDTSSPNCRNVTIKIPALRSECWLTIFRDGQKGATQRGEFYDGAKK